MTQDADADFRDDLVPSAPAWPGQQVARTMPVRLTAEALGTAALIAVGLGAVVLVQPYSQSMTLVPGLAFGAALFVLTVALGRVSGAHLNPAVTIALWAAGRFPGRDIAPYVLAQVVGGVVAGAAVVGLLVLHPASGAVRTAIEPLANGWGEHSPWHISLWAALIVECLLSAAFVAVVLRATSVTASPHHAPAAIAVTFGALMALAIPLTNGAFNPVRATSVAVYTHPWALGQLWAWWLAPAVGAVVVGLAYRAFGSPEDGDDAAHGPSGSED